MANTIIGKVLSIGQAVNVSRTQNPFYKRELVLDASRYDPLTGDKRENYPAITFASKNCALLDSVCLGELVEVSFVLQGRAYTTREGQSKFITDVIGYRVEKHSGQKPSEAALPAAPAPPAPPAEAAPPAESGAGLPF